MYKTKTNDLMDFYFNDKQLSDFGGYVGSTDGGLNKYSGLPAREIVSDKALKTDIETVFNSYLTSRSFPVPVVFENLDDGDIRKISAWLNSPTPSPFYYVGDSIYINAMLDSDSFDFEMATIEDGEMELKFICHDPYFYSMQDKTYTSSSLTSGTEYTFTNDGTEEAYPNVEIRATDSINLKIYDSNKILYSETNITNIVSGVVINSITGECTTLAGGDMINDIDEFPVLPSGKFYFKVTGSQLNSLKMTFKERYI